MAGIYQRDNYAQLMQNALNSAYNRSAATQRERAERVKEIVNAGGDFAKVVGRTAEEWNVPDKYEDNPDYRAARFDYILSGDRSGLDAFRQAEMQAEQARRQQEFTAAENALNRRMQMAENEKNREIQRQQHGLEIGRKLSENHAKPDMTKEIAGPINAVSNSCHGLRGRDVREAHPPRSDIVMSRVRYPNARAVNEWPSSCATMESASASAKLRP